MKSQKLVKVRRLNTPNPGSGCGSDGRAFASNSRGLHSLSENCDHNVGHFGILSYFSTLEEMFFQIGSNLTSVGSTFLHNLLL